MTLRARLTTAFLAVVLGPVLLGASFVGATVAAVTRDRSLERLDVAVDTVRSSVGFLCQQLRAAADAVALLPDPAQRVAGANQVVARGLGSAVRIEGPAGATVLTTAGSPPRPWADCAGPGPAADLTFARLGAIAVRVELRDPAGTPLGAVYVAQALDEALVGRFAAASGTAVTLLAPATGPGTAGDAALSTEAPGDRDAVLRVARATPADTTGETPDGRYVRRVDPGPGQPLRLVLSVPRRGSEGLYGVLVATVVLAGLVAVVAAWWLARSTTRPLAELAHAAERVAAGDLDARVPVRGQDEVGWLAGAFNRMTREMQAYVHALTAGRDQLRGHLGVLGDTLSSTHDLGRILQVILQTALAATGARAGVVLLLDPAEGVLVGRCAEGLDERWPPESGAGAGGARQPGMLRVPLGAGVLGTVAATGVPLRGRVGRGGPPLSAREPRGRTYVAVPLAVPTPGGADGASPPAAVGRTGSGASLSLAGPPPALGVLALYDRLGSDEFDDTDLVTLRNFAGQAAVAVDNVRLHEEARRLSVTDPLTGLRNYRDLRDSIRGEVERASRFGHRLAVLALDLDRFKEVNDTHGHAAGDAVLAEFARRIRTVVRGVDLAFRQGGEEFVVLLPETDARGGMIVAERLGAAVRNTPIVVDAQPAPLSVAVSVSIGVAVFPDHAATAQQVLDAADDALYAAKAAGRDTHRLASRGARPGGGSAGGSVGGSVGGAGGGAPGGVHPPRQTRGR